MCGFFAIWIRQGNGSRFRDSPPDVTELRRSERRTSARLLSQAADADGHQRLARYIVRCPFALEKMRHDRKSGMVIHGSRLHATVRRAVDSVAQEINDRTQEEGDGDTVRVPLLSSGS